MNRFSLFALILLSPTLLAAASPDAKPKDTPPVSTVNTASLQLAADAAFDKKDYNTALPLYMKVAQGLTDQPDRLKVVQERITTCQKNVTKAIDPLAAPAEPQVQVKTSAEERKPHIRPKDGQVLECAIKELGNFEYDAEKGGNLPADITKLSGCKFRTHGFMIPLDAADNITEFALVPSLFACCFGQPPQIQHTLVVHTPKGKAVGYFPEEITVEGTLTVREKKEDGFVVSVFEVECTSVKPAPK
jgi:hypothetical protein